MRKRKPESRPTFTAKEIEEAQEAVRKHSTAQAKPAVLDSSCYSQTIR